MADCRAVLFFEMRLSPWDYSAAWLILKEAGGVVTTMDGDTPDLNIKHSLMAGTPTAHAEFSRMVQEIQKPRLS